MSQITIVPEDGVVVIGGVPANGVDMSLVDPEIHAIQFNEEMSKGWVEFKPSAETGLLPPQEEIANVDPWQPQIQEANEIIYCRNNPKTFYSTMPPVGSPILVSSKGWPQPPNSTEETPPEKPSDNSELYWKDGGFVWSTFPVDLTLAEAKTYMKDAVSKAAYDILQPTDWYAARKVETGADIPVEWATWREGIRTQAQDKISTVTSKRSKDTLNQYCQSSEFLEWNQPPSQ